MNALATTRRILTQLRHDPRTVVLLVAVPSVLMILLRYVLDSEQRFSAVAPALLGIFPFTIMFLLTSVTTLRERTTGTLTRLMTMPIGKLDLLLGYALAFGLLATLQVVVAAGISLTWLGLAIAGSVWVLLLIVVLDALLGTALGLFVSAFARTEFQAIQFLPVFVLPQFLLCGLFVPRGDMGWVLSAVSDVLPLSYAVDALTQVTRSAEVDGTLVRDIGIIAGCAVLALLLGAATLRRRTP
ncbi:ABC transporter [Amycolatopsis mediterranei S699]|uniref:Transport permease protein n=2 Tax=Amycolatopsis mediterranei TaxID=33910 RepID=A0A0H3DFW5_AMYMU|nr:ABC transporter permease [Amycolatopsis mediterranei]ADJ49097.1 ABC-2 type transporter [Amycolatopsis mediterranei U32]AEK46058.1 ABC transporter [Amycolatopsis mediterranei S699]AFO80805.1 ABC transporter [Amycolatopsis mediterranei S699]AGT87933.1 ABC transporter [Amycolatopsis mediterranei RB]KDO04078.1 antibiotic ABC transporter permease [Amycolatopsis mediterranei]